MTKPIRPEEIAKNRIFPDFVIEAFNRLITKNFRGTESRFTQNDAAALIMSLGDIERSEVFNKRYLDVEDIYNENGWDVEYDRPGYNETYEAFYVFRRKENK